MIENTDNDINVYGYLFMNLCVHMRAVHLPYRDRSVCQPKRQKETTVCIQTHVGIKSS